MTSYYTRARCGDPTHAGKLGPVDKLLAVASLRAFNTKERHGQALFNALAHQRPDLAAAVGGTDLDPFYDRDGENPERLRRLSEFLRARW